MNYFDWVDAVVSGLLDEAIRGNTDLLPPEERQAVQLIFDRGFEAGLLPQRVVAEFV